MTQPLGKPVVPEVIMTRNGSLPSISTGGSSVAQDAIACSYSVVSCGAYCIDGENALRHQSILHEVPHAFGFTPLFNQKRAGLEELDHRVVFMEAPAIIEGNRDGADFG